MASRSKWLGRIGLLLGVASAYTLYKVYGGVKPAKDVVVATVKENVPGLNKVS